jgi:hypothetical protein
MVQMGTPEEAENIVHYLHGVQAFGSPLSIRSSKQTFIREYAERYFLPNGTNGYADFTNSRNQRFSNPNAQRNRIVFPTNQLYFFNVPKHFSEEQVMKARLHLIKLIDDL